MEYHNVCDKCTSCIKADNSRPKNLLIRNFGERLITSLVLRSEVFLHTRRMQKTCEQLHIVLVSGHKWRARIYPSTANMTLGSGFVEAMCIESY